LRAGYQYHTEARIDKLRAAGYAPAFIALEDGVRRYVRGHLLPRAAQ
jgi:ADP-L-glycero-D-manno-heptose 6-epimerase